MYICCSDPDYCWHQLQVHSYLGFTDLRLTDIGSNGQNLQQRTHLVYITIIIHLNLRMLNYCVIVYNYSVQVFTLSDWIVCFIKCTLLYYSSLFGNIIVVVLVTTDNRHYRTHVSPYCPLKRGRSVVGNQCFHYRWGDTRGWQSWRWKTMHYRPSTTYIPETVLCVSVRETFTTSLERLNAEVMKWLSSMEVSRSRWCCT